MKEFRSIASSYIKRNLAVLATLFLILGIFLGVFSLYSLPLEAVGYATLLIGFFVLIIGVVNFHAFFKKHRALEKMQESIPLLDPVFPSTRDLIERDYQELLKNLAQDRGDIISQKDKAYTEMRDYYTIWAHQIKTPIAAMRLLLQVEQAGKKEELLDQLFKIEQYVEMVLQYIRMESLSNDLVFREISLDEIVKQVIRKYAKSFIRQKVKLNYQELNRTVLTDEKWLVFVIEQILSNALKYTPKGEITITLDPDLPMTLVIEDTGIGIEPEDLPRVFEKGFTGYNGRADKKSTGIGLYLCKQILNKLSHTIRIESQVGKGTRVKIGLDTMHIAPE
jgi:signal transduction histidine kinase